MATLVALPTYEVSAGALSATWHVVPSHLLAIVAVSNAEQPASQRGGWGGRQGASFNLALQEAILR